MLLLNTVSISLRAKIEQLHVYPCRHCTFCTVDAWNRVAPAPGSIFSRSRLLRATVYDLNEKAAVGTFYCYVLA
jgi:hypothetical protein